ncbi:MAG: hypothetical protein LC808_03865 [Actinobacteria bacterium]|nr:hypothetical protein [Actinomycetota bacterium]
MRVLGALVTFLVFGAVATAMGRAAARDLRDGARTRDGVSVFAGLEALIPTVIAGLVALIAPILILARG